MDDKLISNKAVEEKNLKGIVGGASESDEVGDSSWLMRPGLATTRDYAGGLIEYTCYGQPGSSTGKYTVK